MASGPCGYRVLQLQGPQATVFAQAQFMNDVAALEPGRWQWNGWLTPKGRVVAIFALAMIDAQTLQLVLPDADPDDLAAQLRRFVFRSKVLIEPLDAIQVLAIPCAPTVATGNRMSLDDTGAAELDFGSEGQGRHVRLSRAERADEPAAAAPDWRVADLEFGLPRLDATQAGAWTPQQLSLERLNAYSVRKGCYPGQEIVARTHFLGKAKRGLVLLESAGPVMPGTEVRGESSALGTVVSAASDASRERHVALAVMPLERAEPPQLAGDVAVKEIQLREGLAR